MKRIIFTLAGVSMLLSHGVVRGEAYLGTNLVSDDPLSNPAQIIDADLKNAWGMSFAPAGPFWISDNATGVSTLYQVDPATNATTKLALTVTIRGDGSVTGQTFNG